METSGSGSRQYDTIGVGYRRYRRRDPRFAAAIEAAIGAASRVVDVGRGTGSYEPSDREVVAVEPSRTMIDQRPACAAPVVQAVAEHLPFADGAFDAALAVLTIHHWSDLPGGLRELARVAPRQVILTFDPTLIERYWLYSEYLPALRSSAASKWVGVPDVSNVLRVGEVRVVPVAWDCTDGIMGAYWRRPEMYLDPGARRAISGFHRLDQATVMAAMSRLEHDIATGAWAHRHSDLLEREELDFGLRLVISQGARPTDRQERSLK